VTLQLQGTTVGDLDAARRLIEPQVAGNLAAAHTDDDLAALRDAVDLAEETAERDDAEAFGRAAAGVHETLMERSGNQTLTTISRLLHDLVQDYYERANQGVGQRTMRRAVRSYRRFVELIEAGDVAAATAHWQAQMTFTITGNDASRPVAVPAEGRAKHPSPARASARPSRIVIARR
jgi:GntR family transcriptional regulator, transcriptional repressor for pyruvate dehydrogenase complex